MEICKTHGTDGLRGASTYWFWLPQQRNWAPSKQKRLLSVQARLATSIYVTELSIRSKFNCKHAACSWILMYSIEMRVTFLLQTRLITDVYQQAWQAAEYLGTKQRNSRTVSENIAHQGPTDRLMRDTHNDKVDIKFIDSTNFSSK